jgi:thymidylate synthase ThyX
MKDKHVEIEDLRRVMGTLPTQSPELTTGFVRGVEGITVELVDYNKNPYKGMYILATSCWGSKINKWKETAPEHRFMVVKAALEGQALPLALEVPKFTFVVEGPSRAAFDQMARTRDAVFSAKGMRDNNWKNADIRIPTSLWPTEEDYRKAEVLGDTNPEEFTEEDKRLLSKLVNFNEIVESMHKVKKTYADIVDVGKSSWQAARTVLPLYVVYGYSVSYTYLSLKKVCANRMKFCEMEDTCAVAWLMQQEVSKKFPLIGSYLRPGCDYANKCQYHSAYAMSEMFGCLFRECGRNQCQNGDGYAEFNETCTNYMDLEEQLNIHITRPDEWPSYTWDTLPESDKALFMED